MPNFVCQLSKTMARRFEVKMVRLSLEPARTWYQVRVLFVDVDIALVLK